MSTQEINVHNLTRQVGLHTNIMINNVTGDQYNCYLTFPQVEAGGSSSQVPSSLSFNDAPLDLLSVHFTGREKGLDRV
jgi:hypothetical protein